MPLARLLLVYSMSITASGGMLASIETHAAEAGVVAEGYFVDCDAGSDSAAGTSHTAPWRTLAKVSDTVRAQGADIWIKAGTVCSDQTLRIGWSRTHSDSV